MRMFMAGNGTRQRVGYLAARTGDERADRSPG